MAEAKTKPTGESVKDFIERLPDETRRKDCRRLVTLMRAATGEAPTMWGPSIVGFGLYRYKYASGREGDWPIVAFSPRKNDLTLYFMPGFDALPEVAKLGKYKTGKVCLYVKKLADVDEAVLVKIIAASVKAMEPQRVKP